MLNHIRIVLVNTSHPGNIGSAARAVKTMGLSSLYLVAPKEFPHPKADEMAVSAKDILQNAVVTETLHDAIHDCSLVIGTSARERSIPWPKLDPREMAEKIKREEVRSKIAILFGPEQSGLENEALEVCHYHLQIPANPLYSSINLAQAVQIIVYELYVASLSDTKQPTWDYPFATREAMEKFYAHLEKVLIQIDFLKPSAPRRLMTRMKRLFARTRMDEMEINMLRGMLTAVEEQME